MRIAKDFIKRTIAGESVLVPTGDTTLEYNGLITLSDTAAFIWDNIEKSENLQELVDLILANYEIDEQTAKQDVVGFVSELLRRGIFSCTKEDGTW